MRILVERRPEHVFGSRMPWLIKDKVLFIHIPRCGGTSITKHHRVGRKAREGMNPYHKFGLIYYYYRYALLEKANFPVFTYENLLALLQALTASFIYFFVVPLPPAPYVMWAMSCATFTFSTFIWTAPVTMRSNALRYILMLFQHYVLCRFGGETKYMTGTNNIGYLFHITAKRAIKYGYVTQEQVEEMAFSIVRNPFSRMVSMYEYNKRIGESFSSFVEAFHRQYFDIYVGKGTSECRHIYCHVLPMHEYTHLDGEQVVSCVIKQESLKSLLASDFENTDVPPAIRSALSGIPHANSRSRRRPWQEYYNQKTYEKVLEMYREDFKIFNYEGVIPGREDLTPVSYERQPPGQHHGSHSRRVAPLTEASEEGEKGVPLKVDCV